MGSCSSYIGSRGGPTGSCSALLAKLHVPPPGEYGDAPGQVFALIQDVSGKPIPSAMALLETGAGPTRWGGVSDDVGRVVIDSVPAGDYRMKVMRIGYLGQLHDVRVLPSYSDSSCVVLRYIPANEVHPITWE